MTQLNSFPSPDDIKKRLPLLNPGFIEKARNKVKNIFQNKEEQIALILGPCSIHNEEEALIYAEKIKELFVSQKLFYPVMRVYCEKPRTTLGWKGLICDPDLNESNDFEKGICKSRKLLLQLADKNIPCATEFLDPLVVPYLDDLITWGFIGARTTASQPHRMLASSLSFPIGFKNAVDGDVRLAAEGAFVANKTHHFLGIDTQGQIVKKKSMGNPFAHVALRGADSFTNYDSKSVQQTEDLLQEYELRKRILIDCAHGNSNKCPEKQKEVFKEVLLQILEGNTSIMGIMLESNIHSGSQKISSFTPLKYGVSLTDPCISLEETRALVHWALDQMAEKCLAL